MAVIANSAVSRPFLKLDLLPKAIYNHRQPVVLFYEAYFALVTH